MNLSHSIVFPITIFLSLRYSFYIYRIGLSCILIISVCKESSIQDCKRERVLDIKIIERLFFIILYLMCEFNKKFNKT